MKRRLRPANDCLFRLAVLGVVTLIPVSCEDQAQVAHYRTLVNERERVKEDVKRLDREVREGVSPADFETAEKELAGAENRSEVLQHEIEQLELEREKLRKEFDAFMKTFPVPNLSK